MSSAVSDSVVEGTLSRSIKVGSAMTVGAASVGGGAVLGARRAAVPLLGARRGLLTADAGVVAMTRTSGSRVTVSGASCAKTVAGTASAKRLTVETNPKKIVECPDEPTQPATQTAPRITTS